ncbi:MAG: tetratricopeptide repeat protein [Paracoccaceae bacterium]|nr:tetratricopeptide repeat protein [Paracoccaceae bacterium]
MKDYISEYRKNRPIYKALCSVVAQVIEASFGQANVRFHSIDPRAKDVESFERKACKTDDAGAAKYQNPLEEITDLAGVRVIVFTIDDIAMVTEFVDENFEIIEKRDVGEERVEKGQFGYQSIHYLVRLTEERLALPEFAAYRNYVCEIQVRTVLQHAWAEMEHDIQYKGSKNIPKTVRRKFLSLAGLLEIADREFASIQRADRELKRGILTDLQKDLTKDAITSPGEQTTYGGTTANVEKNTSGVQVRDLLSEGRYAEAIELYNKKIESEPTSYTLFIGRARALFLVGETEKALKDLDKVDELQADNPHAASLRSKIVGGRAPQTLAIERTNPNADIKRGDDALADGDAEAAFSLYSDAQSAGASWPFTTFKMALAGAVAGDFKGAEILLGELKINPGTPMEINIRALKTILIVCQDQEGFTENLQGLKTLVEDKGDFNFDLSPLSLLDELRDAERWGDKASSVAEVLDVLKG